MELAAQVLERTADKFAAAIKGNSTITVVEDRNNQLVDGAGAGGSKGDFVSCHKRDK